MVWDIVRDSTFGQLVRLATSNKYFSYPEERADFEFVKYYSNASQPPYPRDESESTVQDTALSGVLKDHHESGTPASNGT
jgi:MFS transporter, DHA1 family, multidrug resistance protein